MAAKLMVRESLTRTMVEKYRDGLSSMILKKGQQQDLAAGFLDGFNAAIHCLTKMGLIEVATPEEIEAAKAAESPAVK